MFDPVTLMTWDEARSSCTDNGGDLMGHETPHELDAISNWIAPGLCISFMEWVVHLKLWYIEKLCVWKIKTIATYETGNS